MSTLVLADKKGSLVTVVLKTTVQKNFFHSIHLHHYSSTKARTAAYNSIFFYTLLRGILTKSTVSPLLLYLPPASANYDFKKKNLQTTKHQTHPQKTAV